MVLFLSSDIITFHPCMNFGGLSLLRSMLYRANIGHRRLRTLRCFSLSRLCFSHTLFGSFRKGVLIIFLGQLWGFGLRKGRLHIDAHAPFEQKRLLVIRGRETALPVLTFVQTCQPSGEDNLGSEGGFNIPSKDSTVADLWRDHLIDGEQRTLTEIRFLRIGIGVGSGCAGRLAVEISGVMVTAAVDDLRGKSGEQCLCAFRAIN